MTDRDRETLQRAAGARGAGTAYVSALARAVLRIQKQDEMGGRAAGAPAPQERTIRTSDVDELDATLAESRDRLAAVEGVASHAHARVEALEQSLRGDEPDEEPTPDAPAKRADPPLDFPSAKDVAKGSASRKQPK